MKTTTHNDVVLLELDPVGPLLQSDRDAADLVGDAFSVEADVVVIPIERLSPEFLELKSGIAGIFFQKLQNYQRRLAIVGDISAAVAASKSLHDFVYETNRHGEHLFVTNREELLARL